MIKVSIRHLQNKSIQSKLISVDSENETFSDFLFKCSEQLECKAKRVFTTMGQQIYMIPDIISSELYLISEGDQYVPKEPISIINKQTSAYSKHSLNESALQKEQAVRVAILGQAKSGKTSLVCQYLFNKFSEEYQPTIEDIYQHQLVVDEEQNDLQILDTAGVEEYRSIINEQKVKERDAYIICINIGDQQALTNLDDFYRKIYGYHPQRDVSIVLVGCQNDRERKILYKNAEKFAQDRRSPYIECSALNNDNICEVFNLVCREVKKYSERRVEIFNNFSQQKACCDGCSIF